MFSLARPLSIVDAPARAPSPRFPWIAPAQIVRALAARAFATHPVLQAKNVPYTRLPSRLLPAPTFHLSTPLTRAMTASAHTNGQADTANGSTQTNGVPKPHAGELKKSDVESESRWSVAKGM